MRDKFAASEFLYQDAALYDLIQTTKQKKLLLLLLLLFAKLSFILL